MQNNYKIIEIENIKDFVELVLKIYPENYNEVDYKQMEFFSEGPPAYTGRPRRDIMLLGYLYLTFKEDNRHNKKWLKEEKNGEIYWYKPVIKEVTANNAE